MKIYNYINNTKKISSITANEWTAKLIAAKHLKEGDDVHVYEGDLKTQGKNFDTWANNWKEIKVNELPF